MLFGAQMQDASREYRALGNARRKGWVPICVGRRSPSPHPPRAFVPTVRLFLGSWPLYRLCQSLVAVDCVCDWEYNSSRAPISQPDRSIRQHRLPSPLPLPNPKKKRGDSYHRWCRAIIGPSDTAHWQTAQESIYRLYFHCQLSSTLTGLNPIPPQCSCNIISDST